MRKIFFQVKGGTVRRTLYEREAVVGIGRVDNVQINYTHLIFRPVPEINTDLENKYFTLRCRRKQLNTETKVHMSTWSSIERDQKLHKGVATIWLTRGFILKYCQN